MCDRVNLSWEEAITLVANALQGVGTGEQQAQLVAEALVLAEVDGRLGHGISRLVSYAAQVKSGKINSSARVGHTFPKPSILLTDADHGFAYPAIREAIEQGISIAQTQGSVALLITRSHHCGVLGHYVERLANQGLVALMLANTPKAMAPWGGNAALFGTNPIAFACPRRGQLPLVVDLSLSKVARGKVLRAQTEGKVIPEDWAIDAEGRATTDPAAALQGSMLPMGDAKGAVLAMMVEIFAAALTNSSFGFEANSFLDADGGPPSVGQVIFAITPPKQDSFLTRIDILLQAILAQPGTRLPGDNRYAMRDQARAAGLSILKKDYDSAKQLAA